MKRKTANADQWVKKATAKGKAGKERPGLAQVYQVDGCTIAADGYRLHAVGPVPEQADGEAKKIVDIANLVARNARNPIGTLDADLLREIAQVMRAGSTSAYPNRVTCWPADGAMRIKALTTYESGKESGKYPDAEYMATIAPQEAQIAADFKLFQVDAVYLSDAVAVMDGPVTIRRTVEHQVVGGRPSTHGILHLADTHGHTALVVAMSTFDSIEDTIDSPSVSQ